MRWSTWSSSGRCKRRWARADLPGNRKREERDTCPSQRSVSVAAGGTTVAAFERSSVSPVNTYAGRPNLSVPEGHLSTTPPCDHTLPPVVQHHLENLLTTAIHEDPSGHSPLLVGAGFPTPSRVEHCPRHTPVSLWDIPSVPGHGANLEASRPGFRPDSLRALWPWARPSYLVFRRQRVFGLPIYPMANTILPRRGRSRLISQRG